MPYNLHGPALTLTADERAAEAKRLLHLLHDVDDDLLERKTTGAAREFLRQKWLEADLGAGVGVAVTEPQLLHLRDLWGKFQ